MGAGEAILCVGAGIAPEEVGGVAWGMAAAVALAAASLALALGETPVPDEVFEPVGVGGFVVAAIVGTRTVDVGAAAVATWSLASPMPPAPGRSTATGGRRVRAAKSAATATTTRPMPEVRAARARFPV